MKMSASSISMAGKIIAVSSSSLSPQFSLGLCNKLSNISVNHSSLFRIHTPFKFPTKPIRISKTRNQYSNSYSSFLPCLASPYGGIETTQEAQTTDSEPETEQENDHDDDEEEEGDAVESLSIEAGRLYVGNLPYSMTSVQVSEVFSEAGNVVSVEIVYDRVTDRSRGFAFVTMGSIEEAKEAIRLFDGAQVGGRTVRVNFPEVPKGGEIEVMGPKIRSSYQGFVDSPYKIYAGNLSWSLTSQGLREAFSDQPGFLSAKVIYDRGSGRSRGFGFVTFSSVEDVEAALTVMNGTEIEGRPLRLNIAQQRASLSRQEMLDTDSESSTESRELLSGFSL